MRNKDKSLGRLMVSAAAAAATLTGLQVRANTTPQPAGTSVPGNTNINNYATISLSGSTAMRNYTISPGITLLPNGSSIFLSSGTFNASASGKADQLAPTNPDNTGDNSGSVRDDAALRIEWHEQGSVEGILELVSDQIGAPTGAPASLVTRAPTVSNPVWINRNTVAADGGNNSKGWSYGATGTPTGQNAVQMAISDVKPIQAFSVDGTSSAFAVPGTAGYGKGNPLAVTASDSSGLGVAGSRQQLVSTSNLNIADTAHPTAPWVTGGLANLQTNTVGVTATTFSANPGTGLTNVNTADAQFLQLTGRLKNGATFQMSTRDVNSGTRNAAATNTGIDPSWAVGLNDSGNTLVTTVAAAADAQVQINRTVTTASDGTSIPNAAIRFSGKTAGGVLRATIQNSRMGVGTLSLPDALSQAGTAFNQASGSPTSSVAPIRVLSYNGVTPTATTITDGSYTIWQQEQYVTVKQTPTALAGLTATQWANTTDLQTGIKGDTANTSSTQSGTVSGGQITFASPTQGGYVQGQTITGGVAAGTTVTGVSYNPDGTIASVGITDTAASGSISYTVSGGDVANFRDNVINSVQVAGGQIGFTSVNNPGDQLFNVGFILPQLMKVTKSFDGQATSPNSNYDINTNPNGYIGDSVYNSYITNATAKKNSAPTPSITNPTGNNGYYGQATRGAGQAGTGVTAAPNVPFTNGNIGITSSNYLFGNFAGNNVRDYQSFQYGLAAAKALYNSGAGVDAFDNTAATSSANDATALTDTQLDNNGVALSGGSLSSKLGGTSSFVGQRGPSGGNNQVFNTTITTATGVSKGDLIVMGDYNGDGRFDGRDLLAMAIGTALSTDTSTTTLGSLAGINTGVLRKNDALDFTQTNTGDAAYNTSSGFSVASNASGFLRQSARAVMSTTGSAPAGSLSLYTSAGTTYFTYDPTGSNAFNKTDVNVDGVVDFNDAVLVDKFAGQSYTNSAQVLAATQQAPITGTVQAANLVLIQQVDGAATIGAADLTAANAALTGSGTTNWYSYSLNKTGSGTINFARTGGTVNVTGVAAFNISAGSVYVVSPIDPFTSSTDSTKSVAVTVGTGSTLQYTGTSSTGVQVDRLAGLNVATGGHVTLDSAAAQANRTLLVVGGLSLAGTGSIDLGKNELIVKGSTLSTVVGSLGSGISSSAVVGDVLTTIAAVDGSSIGSTFDGVSVNAADVIVKYTYFGDANLDGGVDGSDYTKIDSAFGTAATGWANGDFNYDGNIDGSDYTLIDNAFNTQGGSLGSHPASLIAASTAQIASGSSAVPEPATLGIFGMGALAIFGRRRRR